MLRLVPILSLYGVPFNICLEVQAPIIIDIRINVSTEYQHQQIGGKHTGRDNEHEQDNGLSTSMLAYYMLKYPSNCGPTKGVDTQCRGNFNNQL